MAPVGIALVGTGFALRVQLPALRLAPGAQVNALVGRTAERAAGLAAEHRIPFATDRIEAALERDDVQLVLVSTPPALHRDQCIAVLRAGKHVLCEKPLAVDGEEAVAMVEAARSSRAAALVDHQLRFDPNVRKLRRLVSEGYAGSVRHAHVRMLIDRWIDPREPWSWWHDASQGGGVLAALGSHAIDLVRWLFGDIASARGTLETFVRARPVPGELRTRAADADELAAVTLRHTHGVVSTLMLSVVAHRGPRLRLEVYGSEGTLVLDDDLRLWGSRREASSGPPFEELSEPERVAPAALRTLPDSPWARAFALAAQEIVATLDRGEEPPAEAARFEDGARAQEMIDSIRHNSA